MTVAVPPWERRFRAARTTLPTWALEAPSRCAYATNASGVWQVVSWELDADVHVQLTDKPTGVLGGAPLPDGSGVAWFDDHAGDEVGRWVVTPFGGGPAEPLAPELAEGWSAGLSLRPGRLAVGVADRDGVVLSVVEGGDVRPVYRHRMPADVAGLSRDAQLLAIGHTEHGDVAHPSLRVVRAVDGGVVADLHDGDGMTVVAAGWSPVAGDARLALGTDRTGRDRPEVLDVASGERRALGLDLPGDVHVAGWWPDWTALLLAHDHRGRTELWRYDLATDAVERVSLGGGTVRAAAVRPDGEVWASFSSAAVPPEVRARGVDGGVRTLLVPPGEPAPGGVAYRDLDWDNGEGGSVHGFLAVPDGASPPYPLVVDVHGGPAAASEDAFDAYAQAWVDHGFAVLLVNYRGSTGYGKDWADAVVGDPGRPELVDIVAGVRRLVQDGVVDPARVVVAGASWGGYLTLLALGREPDLWAAGVATVPIADYVRSFEDESPLLQDFDRTLFGGGPDEVGELYRERSPITYVDRVRAPVLIITGENDTRCPRPQVDAYVAALERAGVPHRYDVFDAGHGSLAVDETIRQVRLALDFLADHLGTAPAQP